MGSGIGTLDNKKIRMKPLEGLLLGVVSAGLITSIVFTTLNEKKRELCSKIELEANTNGIPGADAREWAKVYEFSGLTYDASTSNPIRDLSIKQMKAYLNKK